MSTYGFRERVLEVYENGAALTASTTQTSLLPASAKEFTMGAGLLRQAKTIVFDLSGQISTVVTTPGTLALALRLGTVDIFASGLMPLNIVAKTNVHWSLKGELVCRTRGVGTSTVFHPKGIEFKSHAVIGAAAPAAGGAGVHLLPFDAAPANGSGMDFSVSQLLDLMATWSISNANSITLTAGSVDVYTQ